MSGLLGLNLLDALSAIIAERAKGRGSRCHMVRRVKAGELCGTIAGMPWRQETRRDGKEKRRRWRGEGLRDSVGTGGVGCDGAAGGGFCVTGKSSGWNYYKRGGRSSWIDMRESSVRCYTTGRYE